MQFIGPSAVHPHSLDAAHADQLYGDIVTAVTLIGEVDKFSGRGLQIRIPCYDLSHFLSLYGTVQAIAAKKKHISDLYLAIADFDVHEKIVAERTAEQMARLRLGGITGGKQAESNLLGDHRVIAGNLRGDSMADQI